MQTVVFEPLRWQDQATRVTIKSQNAHPEAFFQVTAPQEIRAMAIGRPVEELPRILGILGPAHHIAGALALDRLFAVQAPEPARNMRRGLLQTYFYIEHMQRIAFLLFSRAQPFADLRVAKKSDRMLQGILTDVMHAIALAQQAARILGGRSEHPITAVAGGISRFLKSDAYGELAEISTACLTGAKRATDAMHEMVLGAKEPHGALPDVAPPAMAYLSAGPSDSGSPDTTVFLQEDGDTPATPYQVEAFLDAIGIENTSWTHGPFAFIKAHGWPGLQARNTKGLYFVGPLARLNAGKALHTPLAEQERTRMIDALGPPPHFDLKAACWALVVEVLQAAEHMAELFIAEKFSGPVIREIPTSMGTAGLAGIEAPKGFIAHSYQVDPLGMVQDVQVLDTTVQNNALYCLLTQQAVEVSRRQNQSWKQAKAAIELSLLPF